MKPKPCHYCKRMFTPNNGRQYACHRPECRDKLHADYLERQRTRRRKGKNVSKYVACEACGDMVYRVGRWAIKYCDKPECQAVKNKKRQDALKGYVKYRKTKRPPTEQPRKCQGQLEGCLGTIDNENYYYCSYCHRRLSQYNLDVPGAYGGLVGQEVF